MRAYQAMIAAGTILLSVSTTSVAQDSGNLVEKMQGCLNDDGLLLPGLVNTTYLFDSSPKPSYNRMGTCNGALVIEQYMSGSVFLDEPTGRRAFSLPIFPTYIRFGDTWYVNDTGGIDGDERLAPPPNATPSGSPSDQRI